MSQTRGGGPRGEGHYRPGIAQGGLFGPPDEPKPRIMKARELKESGIKQVQYGTGPEAGIERKRDADTLPPPPKPPRVERRWDGDSEDVVLKSK